ncbi:TetR/AcrR family transcriptional regulator [Actinomycetospora endophytica]|uniref:TetR/AcrR family transcriptional regulator n=1 Tax=Actinomycetospora endophytica TaxID=2291215 RepID=A0ABS8PI38_9PSEU|nr:TetR/AcrR family transcriptional regulator [Actinomycetospora endophytica]MCD2197925.1 TetR/AcrR family transcriptional regulator [Actinomycetospora endophytica]
MTTPAGRELLERASELFYDEGITAVGVAGIAEAAGVTKKTLYDCFGSKAALVAAYLRQRHDRWWSYLQERLAEEPSVLTLFDTYLAHPWFDTERGCAFQRAAAELPDGHPGRAVIVEHKAAVQAEIARLVEHDEALAEHLFLLLEGAVARRGTERTTAGLEAARRCAEALVSTN